MSGLAPLQTGVELKLVLSVVSAVASVSLTAIVGLIAWYLRGEYREFKKNTAVRRWLVGDPAVEEVNDEGYAGDLNDRFDELRSDVEEVDQNLTYVVALLRRLVTQYENEHDHELDLPEGGPLFRGGTREPDRSRGDD